MNRNAWNHYFTFLSNPNHFFLYRLFYSEPKQTGKFTSDECSKFIERLNYFWNVLDIKKIPWDYFSICLSGRACYQCTNFYKELIITKKKDKDENYPSDSKGYPYNIFSQGNNIP